MSLSYLSDLGIFLACRRMYSTLLREEQSYLVQQAWEFAFVWKTRNNTFANREMGRPGEAKGNRGSPVKGGFIFFFSSIAFFEVY